MNSRYANALTDLPADKHHYEIFLWYETEAETQGTDRQMLLECQTDGHMQDIGSTGDETYIDRNKHSVIYRKYRHKFCSSNQSNR